MSGFSQAYTTDNPNAAPNAAQSSGQPMADNKSAFSAAYNQDNQASQIVGSQDQVQGGDYLGAIKSGVIGAAKGAANIADILLTPTIQGVSSVLPGKTNPEASFSKVAEKYLPEPSNKPVANIAQGATTGATMGPAGAVIGGASAAGTEALNKIRPNSPIANVIEPAIASVFLAPGLVNQVLKAGRIGLEGLGLKARDPLVQARIDQAVTSGTPASVSDSDFWYKMQRGIGEALFGKDVNKAQTNETSQIESAVNKQAEKLFPGETSKQSVGTDLKTGMNDGVSLTKQLFNRYTNALDTAVPPHTTQIDMYPYVARLIDDISPHIGTAEQMGTLGVTKGDAYIESLMNDIVKLGNGDKLPLDAVRRVKSAVGDKLEESIMNGDLSKKQLKIIYGNLADAEGSAYAGTPYEASYKNLKNAQAEFYSSMENFVEPLLKENMKPETIAQQLASGLKLGDTRLQHVFKLLDTSAPAMKQEFASMILNNLGQDTRGMFSAGRFFTNWQRLSPEAKSTLFSESGDIPKAYDQLALLSENKARADTAINPSRTAGTLEVLGLLSKFGAAIGGLAGYEMSSHESNDDMTKMAEGAGFGTLAMNTLGIATIGKLMTNPGFVRWLATPTPLNQLPMHLKGLAAVAGEYPEIKDHITAFSNFATRLATNHPPSFVGLPSAPGVQKSLFGMSPNPPKGLMGGGYTGWPEQTPTGYSGGGPGAQWMKMSEGYAEGGMYDTQLNPQEESIFQQWKKTNAPNDSGADYDLRGAYKAGLNPAANGHWSDEFKKPNHPTFSNESKYSKENPSLPAGSWNGDTFIPPNGFALGGLTDQPHDIPDYPTGYIGGGSVWGGPNPIPYAGGGAASSMHPVSANTNNSPGTPSGWDERGVYLPVKPPISILDMFSNKIPVPANSNKFAQGGISHNKDDPRPFYNAQLPAVTGGGWAEGGPANDNNLFSPSSGHLMKPSVNGYGGMERVPVIPSSIGVQQEKSIANWNKFLEKSFGEKPSYPLPTKVKDVLNRNDKLGFDSNTDAIRGLRESGKDWKDHWDFSDVTPERMGYNDIEKQRFLNDRSLLERFLSAPAGTFNDENFAEGGPVDPANAGGNVDIAKALFDKIAKLDRLRTENELDPFLSFERIQKQMPTQKAQGGYIENSAMGYAGGGLAPTWTANDNNSILNRFLGGIKQGLPMIEPFGNPNKGLIPLATPLQGANSNSRISGYAEGGQVDKFQQAVNYISQNTGMSPDAAKGAVKYMYKNESGLDPNIVNPTSGAYGLAQHLGSRKRELMATYGDKPSFESQLEFITKELKGPYKHVLVKLMNADEKQGYDTWGRDFEIPGAAALAKAGVNYRPGDISVASKGATSSRVATKEQPDAIINMFLAQQQQEEDAQEEPDVHEQLRNALTENAEPATKAVIESILGGKHEQSV